MGSADPDSRVYDLLLEEARAQREAQFAHWDSLDTKAGLVLGFAGVLVGLSPDTWLGVVARIIALFAAALALGAFWPRKIPGLNLPTLRRVLVSEQAARNPTRRLLATLMETDRRGRSELLTKATRVKFALAALLVAAILAAIAGGGGENMTDDERPKDEQQTPEQSENVDPADEPIIEAIEYFERNAPKDGKEKRQGQ